jgi:hypothetical protein
VRGNREIRHGDLTSDPEKLPAATIRFVMTNLPGDLRHELGYLDGLRTWIAVGFKQIKNELDWVAQRLTHYATIVHACMIGCVRRCHRLPRGNTRWG